MPRLKYSRLVLRWNFAKCTGKYWVLFYSNPLKALELSNKAYRTTINVNRSQGYVNEIP